MESITEDEMKEIIRQALEEISDFSFQKDTAIFLYRGIQYSAFFHYDCNGINLSYISGHSENPKKIPTLDLCLLVQRCIKKQLEINSLKEKK